MENGICPKCKKLTFYYYKSLSNNKWLKICMRSSCNYEETINERRLQQKKINFPDRRNNEKNLHSRKT